MIAVWRQDHLFWLPPGAARQIFICDENLYPKIMELIVTRAWTS